MHFVIVGASNTVRSQLFIEQRLPSMNSSCAIFAQRGAKFGHPKPTKNAEDLVKQACRHIKKRKQTTAEERVCLVLGPGIFNNALTDFVVQDEIVHPFTQAQEVFHLFERSLAIVEQLGSTVELLIISSGRKRCGPREQANVGEFHSLLRSLGLPVFYVKRSLSSKFREDGIHYFEKDFAKPFCRALKLKLANKIAIKALKK